MHRPDRAAAAEADALQADYFRDFFTRERAALVSELADHVKRVTLSMSTGSPVELGHHRRRVRLAERDIRAIDRMVAALEFRFSDAEVQRSV